MGLLDAPTAAANGIIDPIRAKIANPFSKKPTGGVPGPDFPEGLQIVEIIDGREASKDKIVLAGNMMPLIPFEFGGEQRIAKDYYPGNPEPVVQVLGPKEGDVTIKGRLKDKRYQDDALKNVSTEMQKQLDGVRIRGNLLRITLGEWQRYGFLEKTTFRLKNLSDVEYELSFSIVGFNPPSNDKFIDRSKNVPVDINKNLIAQAAKFQSTYSAVPKSMPRSIADVLNSAISDVTTAVNLVTGFVDTVITTGEDVVASANRAIGLIKNARTNVSRFKRRVGAISFNINSMSNEYSQSLKFSSAYSNTDHVLKSLLAAGSLAAILAKLQAQFEALSKSLPLARYLVKDGDTLQKISIKFYNTAEHWNKIYDHNKLTSTSLTVGSVLEIPKL